MGGSCLRGILTWRDGVCMMVVQRNFRAPAATYGNLQPEQLWE